MKITLTRSKDGAPWERYAEFAYDNKQSWPLDLPADIAELIEAGQFDPALITNNHKHSVDGYAYRINSWSE